MQRNKYDAGALSRQMAPLAGGSPIASYLATEHRRQQLLDTLPEDSLELWNETRRLTGEQLGRLQAQDPRSKWERIADFATGIPSFIDDPGMVTALGVVLAFTPAQVGKALRPVVKVGERVGLPIAAATRGIDRVTGVTRGLDGLPVRTIRAVSDATPSGVTSVTIPAARSRAGQLAERLWDATLYSQNAERTGLRGLGRTELAVRRVGREKQRSLRNISRSLSGTGVAIRRLKLNPEENYTLLVLADNQGLAARQARHERAIAEADRLLALVEGSAEEVLPQATVNRITLGRMAHEIQLDLLAQARKYVDDVPGSGVTLLPDAPERLREGWRLVRAASGDREIILENLDLLTAEGMQARLAKQGQAVRGGRWLTESAAAGDVALAQGLGRSGAREAISSGRAQAREIERSIRDLAKTEARMESRLGSLLRVPRGRKELERVFNQGQRSLGRRVSLRRRIDAVERQLSRVAPKADEAKALREDMYRQQMTVALPERYNQLVDNIPRELELRQQLARLRAELSTEGLTGADLMAAQQKAFVDYERELFEIEGEISRIRNSMIASRSAREQAERNLGAVREATDTNVSAIQRTMDDARGITGGRMIGAEGGPPAKVYVPSKFGVPGGGSGRNPIGWAKRGVATVRGGWRYTVSGDVRRMNPELRKTMTGELIRSGLIDTRVGDLTVDSLGKALKINTVMEWRKFLLSSSSRTRTAFYNTPVKVVPGADTPQELKKMWDLLEAVGQGEKLNSRQLARIDAKQLETYVDDMLQRGLSPAEISALEDIATAEAQGIRWVNDNLVDIVQDASPVRNLDMGRAERIVLGGIADPLSDIFRASILYGNPAYTPVNLMGNAAMNVLQQGAFMPANWARAIAATRTLDREALGSLDELMGHGLTSEVFTLRSAGVRDVSNRVSNLFGRIADQTPRRSAWLHEARRSGFRSGEQINQLFRRVRMGDEGAQDIVDKITRRATDAIVDFERLNAFERKVLARTIFVYPWIKGATRWTARFILDHPLLAGGLAYGMYEAKERADRELGDRPFFAMFDIPIGTDENGNPVTWNPRQLVTPMTPFETFAPIAGWAMGRRDFGEPAGIMAPLLEFGITSITGRDVATGRDVGLGPLNAAKNFAEGTFPGRMLMDDRTEEQKMDSMYPRTPQQEKLRWGLGGTAPKSYNVERAQERARQARGEKKPPVTVQRRREEKSGEIPKATGAVHDVIERVLPAEQHEDAKNAVAVREAVEMAYVQDVNVSGVNYGRKVKEYREIYAKFYPDIVPEVDAFIDRAKTTEDFEYVADKLRDDLLTESGWYELAKVLEEAGYTLPSEYD